MKSMRLYFYSDTGRALFFLEVEFLEFLSEYRFTHSMYLKIEAISKYSKLCKSIIAHNISWRKRTACLDELGHQILRDPDLEKCYFPDFMLDAHGNYNEEYNYVLEHSINWDNLPDYTPVCNQHNPALFYACLYHFYNHVLTDPLLVSKETFLRVIADYPELQNQYVEHLGSSNEFYVTSMLNMDGVSYDIYYMVDDKELKFFFTRMTP